MCVGGEHSDRGRPRKEDTQPQREQERERKGAGERDEERGTNTVRLKRDGEFNIYIYSDGKIMSFPWSHLVG